MESHATKYWREKVKSMTEEEFKETLLDVARGRVPSSALLALKTHPKYGTMPEIRATEIVNIVCQLAYENKSEEMPILLQEYSSIPEASITEPLQPLLSIQLGQAITPAMSHANKDIIKLLLQHGARVEHCWGLIKVTKDEPTTYEPILQDMIDLGVELPKFRGIVAGAATSDLDFMVKFLLRHGANPDDKVAPNKSTPMRAICGHGSLESLRLLFDVGAQIDHNALHKAVSRTDEDRFERIDMLLAHSADINYVEDSTLHKNPGGSALRFANPHHTTPIWEAARAKDVDMVEFLLRRGADPHVNTTRGRPGTEREHMNAVKLLSSPIFDGLRQRALLKE